MVIRGLTTKRFRIEPTLSWVLQQTIFHAIVGIARVEHGAVKPLSMRLMRPFSTITVDGPRAGWAASTINRPA